MVSSKVAQWKGELVKGVIDKIEESIPLTLIRRYLAVL